MNVIKISVPRNNLSKYRLTKIVDAFETLGIKGDKIDITSTATRTTFTVRSRHSSSY